jgi:transposase
LDERGQPRRSKLIIMAWDPDAPKGRYSTKSYIETLTKGLLPYYQCSQLFMQDNAGIYTSEAAKHWLESKRIWYIKWSAYSPDLNPIEYLWWHLKKRMFKHYPWFNNYSTAEEEWNDFCEALQECWMSISKKIIKGLILSMPQHIAACRKARGWQTKS